MPGQAPLIQTWSLQARNLNSFHTSYINTQKQYKQKTHSASHSATTELFRWNRQLTGITRPVTQQCRTQLSYRDDLHEVKTHIEKGS